MLVSVLLTLGVHLCSTGLVEILGLTSNSCLLFIIDLLINTIVIAKIICSKVKALNQTLEIDGFVVYDCKDKHLIGVPEYKISTDMNNYLTAAFSENPALKTLWEQDDIAKIQIVGANKEKRAMGIVTHAGALFVELLEYCVIEKLSTQLSSFFNKTIDWIA